MLGAIIYRLRACNAGLLPITHGRFMHAAFFAALHQASPELATAIHDNVQAKPFTVSQLQFMQPVNLTKDKTVIVIAHRLSTIKKVDRIVVLDKGKIIEDGSHSQLIKKNKGIYKQLWDIQVGGFIK